MINIPLASPDDVLWNSGLINKSNIKVAIISQNPSVLTN